MVTSTATIIARTLAEVWKPRPRPDTPRWAEERFRICDESGATPIRYDCTARRPYLKGILALIDDSRVETVAWRKAAQVGGTTTVLALIASRAELDPSSMGFFGPDQMYVREKRQQFYACAEATEGLSKRIPPPNLRSDRLINLGTCVCYLGWSGSPQTMSGRPCRRVICSEVDKWKDSPKLGKTALLVQARVQSFPNSFQIWYESTPSDETSTIDHLYNDSDQRTWRLRCPICGHFQQLRFWVHREGEFAGKGGLGGIADAKGNPVDAEHARQHAYYICEKGCRLENKHKRAMCTTGVWCPKGQHVAPDGRLVGKPDRGPRNVGVTNSSLDDVSFSFGLAAQEMIKNQAQGPAGMRKLCNDLVGISYRSRGKVPRWQQLGKRLAATHRRGRVPPWAYFLIAQCDVQLNRSYFILRAYGVGKTSALVDWDVVMRQGETDMEVDEDVVTGELASDLSEINRRLVGQSFPLDGVNPWGQDTLTPALVGTDSRYRTYATLSWLRSDRTGTVRLTAGDHQIKPGVLYRKQNVDRHSRSGKPYPGGLERWGIDVSTYKEEIQNRWSIDPEKPGAWLLPSDIMYRGQGEDYLKQVANERMSVEALPKGGEVKRWNVISDSFGNHYWDCEVHGAALADMVVGNDWSQENLDRLAAEEYRESYDNDGVAARAASESHEDFSAR